MKPSGILLVDKPEGPSSHDVVDLVRRTSGIRRVGHTGTLDPFASGLLIVCIGPATRLAEYFHLLPKTYEADVVLGERRDTDDHTGEVMTSTEDWRSLERSTVEEALHGFEGESMQRPPDFSARRKGGRRGYEAARSGRPLDLESSIVHMRDIRLTRWSPPKVGIHLTVSTGTYVRAVARDLGSELGCGAHLGRLRRTAIGPFQVAAAVDASALDAGRAIAPADALSWLRRRRLTDEDWLAISVGRSIAVGRLEDPCPEIAGLERSSLPVALLAGDRLGAIGIVIEDRLQPSKVFHPPVGEPA